MMLPFLKDRTDAKFVSMIGYVLILASLVAMATIAARSADLSATFLFWAVVVFCVITSMMVALQHCDFFAIMSRFPKSASQLFLIGQTIAGVVAATMQVAVPISLAGGDTSDSVVVNVLQLSVVIVVSVTAILNLMAFVPYIFLERFSYYTRTGKTDAGAPYLGSERSDGECQSATSPLTPDATGSDDLKDSGGLGKPASGTTHEMEKGSPMLPATEIEHPKDPWYLVPWACAWQSTSMILIFIVTNGILSGINVRVKSTCYGSRFYGGDVDPGDPNAPPLPDSCWYAPYFVSISCLMFAIGDLVSRFRDSRQAIYPIPVAVYGIRRSQACVALCPRPWLLQCGGRRLHTVRTPNRRGCWLLGHDTHRRPWQRQLLCIVHVVICRRDQQEAEDCTG